MSTTTQRMQGKARRESLVGHTLHDGEYAIERVLGHGGMGNVYLARHTSLKIPLAIKQARADQPLPESVIAELDYTLHGSDIAHRSPYEGAGGDFPSSGGVHTDRFLREALLLARLQHPAIPTLYDYFFEDGSWYLVMDYIPGSTLNSYLHRHAPLAPLEALNYAMQICDVLDYLHRQSPPIVFRDLKPSNIILTPDGALMLVDFGIARYFKEGQINDTTDFGSPGYAPPEQYQGEGQTDGRSDLFSLGIILDEMLSARRSRSSGSLSSPLPQRRNNAHRSAVLSGLITLATRAEPMYRFQSAHTFYQALERVYSIEERLAYERYIFQRRSGPQLPEETDQAQDDATARREEADETQDTAQNVPPTPTTPIETFIPLPPHSPEQRQEIRDALQRARRERLEQEHLVLVDESLKRRTLTTFSQAALRQVKEPEPPPPSAAPPPRPSGKLKRIIRALFFLALLLAIVMTSLLAVRFAHTVMPAMPGKQMPAPPGRSQPLTSSWQALPSLPALEADNTAIYVRVQGRAYVYMSGGFHGDKARPRYDHALYRYDIAAARWEQLAVSLPGMLNNAAASDEQGNIFFSAGYSTDLYSVSSLLYMYDPASGKMRKITPPPSIHIGFGNAIIADQSGHLYLTQGFMQAGDPQAQAGSGWYRYDIATRRWHRLAPLPLALGYTTLALDDNGNILLLGGSQDEAQLHQANTIYRYDSQRNVWQRVEAILPRALSGAASCSIAPDQTVVIGGYNAEMHTALAQSWLVDLRTWRWVELAALPVGGTTLGAAVCDDRGHAFLVRGASDLIRPTRDFWLLTIKE
jgi:serine/threonine protein kinase/N-acetylneuraminic acid mutarotase